MKIRGIVQTNSAVIELTVDGKRISAIAAAELAQSCDLGDGRLRLAAGFIDLQLNGYGGIDFNDTAITTEQITELTRRLWRTGVTSFCPTIVTESAEHISTCLAKVIRAADASPEFARGG